jgi:glycosyltransferase involved in cell wall biosynthesis
VLRARLASIVIPAHNEARVIERLLASVLQGAQPGEFEIVVVCNGCSDDTAARARRFGPQVQVLETPIASKTRALNLGDVHATAFPRFYVDADVQISANAIRDVATLLDDGGSIVVAAPKAVVAYEDRPFLVRAFYRTWTRLPYFSENMIGSGVYAFSRIGRGRFDRFPEITADDEYARLIASPSERRSSPTTTFTIHPPRTLRGLLDIMTRARSGMYEFEKAFPELSANNNTDSLRSLQIIATTPSMWRDAPIYLGVMFLAKLRAQRRLRRGDTPVWERDDTSRQ